MIPKCLRSGKRTATFLISNFLVDTFSCLRLSNFYRSPQVPTFLVLASSNFFTLSSSIFSSPHPSYPLYLHRSDSHLDTKMLAMVNFIRIKNAWPKTFETR